MRLGRIFSSNRRAGRPPYGRALAAVLALALMLGVAGALAGYGPAGAVRSGARATVTPPKKGVKGKKKTKTTNRCRTAKQKRTKYCKAQAKKQLRRQYSKQCKTAKQKQTLHCRRLKARLR